MLVGFGTQVSLPGITFAELTEVSWSGMENEDIEGTHMLSPDGWREFDPSALVDPGELELTVHFDPNESPVFKVKGPIVVTWPAPAGALGGATWECEGFVTGYEPEAPLDDKMTAKVKCKFSGEPTFTASI